MDRNYRLYMIILDCPGITKREINRILGRDKHTGWLDSALVAVEEKFGLLAEDEHGGLYVWEG